MRFRVNSPHKNFSTGVHMKNRNIKLVALLCMSFLFSCSKQENTGTVVQDWHPAINQQLEQLDKNQILTFGMMEKPDGKYCYVSYEGYLRNEVELASTKQILEKITKDLEQIIKTEFHATALDLTKNKKVQSLEELNEEDTKYLSKKSEIECLKVLAERQIDKYTKRIEDRRVSLK